MEVGHFSDLLNRHRRIDQWKDVDIVNKETMGHWTCKFRQALQIHISTRLICLTELGGSRFFSGSCSKSLSRTGTVAVKAASAGSSVIARNIVTQQTVSTAPPARSTDESNLGKKERSSIAKAGRYFDKLLRERHCLVRSQMMDLSTADIEQLSKRFESITAKPRSVTFDALIWNKSKRMKQFLVAFDGKDANTRWRNDVHLMVPHGQLEILPIRSWESYAERRRRFYLSVVQWMHHVEGTVADEFELIRQRDRLLFDENVGTRVLMTNILKNKRIVGIRSLAKQLSLRLADIEFPIYPLPLSSEHVPKSEAGGSYILHCIDSTEAARLTRYFDGLQAFDVHYRLKMLMIV